MTHVIQVLRAVLWVSADEVNYFVPHDTVLFWAALVGIQQTDLGLSHMGLKCLSCCSE